MLSTRPSKRVNLKTAKHKLPKPKINKKPSHTFREHPALNPPSHLLQTLTLLIGQPLFDNLNDKHSERPDVNRRRGQSLLPEAFRGHENAGAGCLGRLVVGAGEP